MLGIETLILPPARERCALCTELGAVVGGGVRQARGRASVADAIWPGERAWAREECRKFASWPGRGRR